MAVKQYVLSVASLEQLQKDIDNVRTTLKNAKAKFIERSLNWFKTQAQAILTENEFGDYAEYFEITLDKNSGKIETTLEELTYIEFGTGIVGQGQPHEQAADRGWEYNVPSIYKEEMGSLGLPDTWSFSQDPTAPLDVQEKNIIGTRQMPNGETRYWTKGQEAIRFMYLTMEMFYNGGVCEKIMREIIQEGVK